MPMEYQTNPNEELFLRLQLARTDTGLYPRAFIYVISDPDTAIETVDLEEVGNGLYGKIWMNNGIRQKYFTQTIVYTDQGYTTIHPLIRPDSDSINVGFNATGGVFGSSRGSGAVVRTELTKEEVERISKALFKLIKPELDKKSEFDVKKDVVKTDIKIPDVKIPEFPKMPDHHEAIKHLSESLSASEKTIIKSIKDNKVEIPKGKDYSGNLQEILSSVSEIKDNVDGVKLAEHSTTAKESVEKLTKLIEEFKKDFARYKVLMMIANGENPASIYQELKELPREEMEKFFRGVLSKNKQLTKSLLSVAK